MQKDIEEKKEYLEKRIREIEIGIAQGCTPESEENTLREMIADYRKELAALN